MAARLLAGVVLLPESRLTLFQADDPRLNRLLNATKSCFPVVPSCAHAAPAGWLSRAGFNHRAHDPIVTMDPDSLNRVSGMVQRIVHRHGGRIWAEATEGDGATPYFAPGGAAEFQPKTSTETRGH